jgi:hypothetical protein
MYLIIYIYIYIYIKLMLVCLLKKNLNNVKLCILLDVSTLNSNHKMDSIHFKWIWNVEMERIIFRLLKYWLSN